MHDVVRAQLAIFEPEDCFQKLRNIKDLKDAKYLGDQYRNNDRNMIMKIVVNAVN